MAEALAKTYAEQRGWKVVCRSGGTLGLIDKPAASNAVRALQDLQIDIRSHRSNGVTDEMARWADYISVMELNHAIDLRQRHLESGDKILQLASFGGLLEVPDPIGGWRWRFRRCRDTLNRCVKAFMDGLPPRLG